MPIRSEVAERANFSTLHYAQCWEDGDIMLEALDVRPGQVCLSIASGGDNTLAMLSRGPARVIAIDVNPAQIAILELKIAAFRELEHGELLELVGSRDSHRRGELYARCRRQLSRSARIYWDGHADAIAKGIGGSGRFERYLGLFRRWILPLAHSRRLTQRLFETSSHDQREQLYTQKWNTWRWRLLCKAFLSRYVMGRVGRDPSFFRYAEGSVAKHILGRTQYALTTLAPAENPYLQWILTGRHFAALPYALRAENFESIRNNLDRIELHRGSLEDFLSRAGHGLIDSFNLSDVFEYMSEESYHRILEKLIDIGHSGGRLAYWNMLVPRRCPAYLAGQLRSLRSQADDLALRDKVFFYRAFVLEEIV
jgi:S-adenosylmethionine-diacylglycerol 3-amino-3-carboxypropyl transferase